MPLELASDEDERMLVERTHHGTAADTAWVLLLLAGVVLGSTSLFWMTWGRFFDHQIYARISNGAWTGPDAWPMTMERAASMGVRLAGFFAATSSIFIIAVAMTSFRRGERWAWYVMWTLPFLATLDLALVAGYGALSMTSVIWDAALFGLAIVALVVSYDVFFPAAPTTPAEQRPSEQPT